jgi:hypothetical protein
MKLFSVLNAALCLSTMIRSTVVDAAFLRATAVKDSEIVDGLNDAVTANEVGAGWVEESNIVWTVGGVLDDAPWTVEDDVYFESALMEAFDFFHGNKDGIFMTKEKITKIRKHETDTLLPAADNKDFLQRKRRTWFDVNVLLGYGCNLCSNDDASSFVSPLSFTRKNDKIWNPQSLAAIAKKTCEILVEKKNEKFQFVDNCSAKLVTPEDMINEMLADADEVDTVVGVEASSTLMK